ncbi:MAG: Hpt domain-containing protein [Archangium sp.]|nr:Hpt domain-containing protein [Archangium sp.]
MVTDEPLDWNALRENCAGDESLVNEVLELFRQEAEALIADVRVAVKNGDALTIKRTAHRLKGALVSLGARPSVEAARALEIAGTSNDVAACMALFERLESELARLMKIVSMPTAA